MAEQKLLLRWGICSAGLISFDFADVLISLPADQHQLSAVVAQDLQRAKKFADTFKIPKTYSNYDDLANDKDIDIIYVGSSQNVHYDMCKLFLNAGKHVLCEKALVCAAWQAKELFELAKEKKVFFMEALWTRCFPFYPKVREIVDSGEIGQLQFVEVRFMYDSIPLPWAERLKREDLGAGVAWDLGVYCLQFADYVFREKPLSVKAVGYLDNGVDMTLNILLQYSNGRFATLLASCVTKGEVRAFVHGTNGNLTVEHPFYTPLKITVDARNKEPRTLEADPLPKVSLPTNYQNSEGLAYEAQHVYDCISKGLLESTLVPHSLSLWMQETLDEVLRQVGRPRLPQKQ